MTITNQSTVATRRLASRSKRRNHHLDLDRVAFALNNAKSRIFMDSKYKHPRHKRIPLTTTTTI